MSNTEINEVAKSGIEEKPTCASDGCVNPPSTVDLHPDDVDRDFCEKCYIEDNEEDERYCDNDDCPYGGYIYDEEIEKYKGKEYICIGCDTGKGLQEREQEECDKCGREDVLECHSSKCIDHDEELKDMCVYCDSTKFVHDLHLSAVGKEGVVKSCQQCRKELTMTYVIEKYMAGAL
tara:strand:+ start:12995 stop:13525 length:531 start_codon:yes stop_codon:yes gene_type:complete